MGKYLINLDDGHIVFRNKYNDSHINLKPISDKIVDMIVKGEVSTDDVISAINTKIRESGEFEDLDAYMEARKLLNMRPKPKYKEMVKKREEIASQLPDRSDEEISLDDIKAISDSSEEEKKEKRRKNAKVLHKELDSMDDGDNGKPINGNNILSEVIGNI